MPLDALDPPDAFFLLLYCIPCLHLSLMSACFKKKKSLTQKLTPEAENVRVSFVFVTGGPPFWKLKDKDWSLLNLPFSEAARMGGKRSPGSE